MDNVVKLKADLDKILEEAGAIETKYADESMPQEETQKWQALLSEGAKIQQSLEDATNKRAMEQASKRAGVVLGNSIAGQDRVGGGFVKLSDAAFVLGKGREMAPGRDMEIFSGDVSMLSRSGGAGYVRLTAEQRKQWVEQALTDFVPGIGAEVIAPDRMAEVVRFEERDTPNLRSLLNPIPTSSDVVRYNRITVSGDAAALTPRGEKKPGRKTTFAKVDVPVGKIAAYTEVADEDLADWPMIQAILDTELRGDVDLALELELLYGTGSSFDGILTNANTTEAREETGDTLIDVIRRAITDVQVANLTATGVLIHPYDWEALQLEKGDGDSYLYKIVTEMGEPRIWSVPVVPSNLLANPDDGSRNLIVADWGRAIRVWDRMRTLIKVGWKDDDLIRNQRTIVCELRAASAVIRPAGVVVHETLAASS